MFEDSPNDTSGNAHGLGPPYAHMANVAAPLCALPFSRSGHPRRDLERGSWCCSTFGDVYMGLLASADC